MNPSVSSAASATALLKQEAMPASSLLRMQFPYKLHLILGDASQKGFDDIINWSPHGRSFRVFSKERFEQEVMSRYFDSNKYKTFQRNLNLWGFQVGENKEIVHKFFVRGKLDLCEKMHRIKIKGAYIRGTRSPKAPISAQERTSLQQQLHLQRPNYHPVNFLEANIRAPVGSPKTHMLTPSDSTRFQERAALLSFLDRAPDLNLRYAIANAVQKRQQDVETRATALMALLASKEQTKLAPQLLSPQTSRQTLDPIAQALLKSSELSQQRVPPVSTPATAASALEAARVKSVSQRLLPHLRASGAPKNEYNLNLLEALFPGGSRA